MNIKLTDVAYKEVKRIAETQKLDNIIVRVKIVGTGCSGFETKLELDNSSNEKDIVTEFMDVKLVTDKRSALYLDNTQIDFFRSDEKTGFVVNNPNVVRCGCKSSCE